MDDKIFDKIHEVDLGRFETGTETNTLRNDRAEQWS